MADSDEETPAPGTKPARGSRVSEGNGRATFASSEELCPLIPGLGQPTTPDETKSWPARLRVYRVPHEGASPRSRTYKAEVPLKASPDNVRDACDHGEGGVYQLQPVNVMGHPVVGPIGELRFDPDPVMHAAWMAAQREKAMAISQGLPGATHELETRLAETEARLAALQSPAHSAPNEPTMAAVLAQLAANQQQSQQQMMQLIAGMQQQRDPLESVERLTTIMRNLQPPVSQAAGAAVDPSSLMQTVISTATKMVELTGGKFAGASGESEADKMRARTESIKSIGEMVDNLLPKVVGGVSRIVTDFKTPVAGATPPPVANGARSEANPAQGEQERQEMNARALLDELDAKLRDAGVTADGIATDFAARVKLPSSDPKAVPGWIGSMLSIVDDRNLDSQLEALGRPAWKVEPMRGKFLAVIAKLRG